MAKTGPLAALIAVMALVAACGGGSSDTTSAPVLTVPDVCKEGTDDETVAAQEVGSDGTALLVYDGSSDNPPCEVRVEPRGTDTFELVAVAASPETQARDHRGWCVVVSLPSEISDQVIDRSDPTNHTGSFLDADGNLNSGDGCPRVPAVGP